MPKKKIEKSENEWREQLTPEQFHVAREKGTERAFTGKYNDNKDAGTYVCVCCGNPLFKSSEKFDSGSGWPSFTAPVDADAEREENDESYGMCRSEVMGDV